MVIAFIQPSRIRRHGKASACALIDDGQFQIAVERLRQAARFDLDQSLPFNKVFILTASAAERRLCSGLRGKRGATAMVGDIRALGRLSDYETLDSFRRSIADLQQTSTRTLAMIADTPDMHRLAERLSVARYVSADKR